MEKHTIDPHAFLAALDARSTSGEDFASSEQRPAETVTALEAIRLELQRLEDGAGIIDGVTAQLEAAREIREAVDRVLAGRGEEAVSGGDHGEGVSFLDGEL